jgi:hypothetical protein
VEFAAHAITESGIDQLVLLDPQKSTERLGRYDGLVMVAIARKVYKLDLCIGNTGFNQGYYVVGLHGHERIVTGSASVCPLDQKKDISLKPNKDIIHG